MDSRLTANKSRGLVDSRPEEEVVREAARIGAELAVTWRLKERTTAYERHTWSGRLSSSPVLHLDDVSAIPFLVDISGVEEYQHRARLRASAGDLFAAVTPVTAGYEEYCVDDLGLGEVHCMRPHAGGNALAVARALATPEALRELLRVARQSGGLALHPYMGIESVFELAAAIHRDSGVDVEVLAPPPPVTWVANDKARLEDVVRATLGPSWLVASRRSASPYELARALCDLALDSPAVALKRLRCASAMGNQVFESKSLLERPQSDIESEVEAFLERTEWDGVEEVLAVAWEDATSSPSTQWWIPRRDEGHPVLDGIYEQILEGQRGLFVGSRPSGLPEEVHRRLALGAFRVAIALQAMGYVGRCSFDHLVVGDPKSEPELRFTECNGRWGGTSIPMSFIDRLIAGPRPPYRAQDFVHEGLRGMAFPEVLARLAGHLYDPRTGDGSYVLYNVGPLREAGKMDVIALGQTQEEAEEALTVELVGRLGLVASSAGGPASL